MTPEQLAFAIKQREDEIQAYQVNIDNYTAIIAMLPKFWPADLTQYKNTKPVDLHDLLPFDLLQMISDLQFKEQLEKTLLTEKLEQRKSRFVLQALLAK
jgi:hypothetical protein